jgi:hypothetical protein
LKTGGLSARVWVAPCFKISSISALLLLLLLLLMMDDEERRRQLLLDFSISVSFEFDHP